ncbi:Cyclase family protein [Histomonas meleagridis]|uniref:Cyclase family protein n=1 Tax=Histomonas meleagridis TaxID=135588 RepID=UPI003559EF1E|nr:Cyclase family protein [Histomonas meleagridis]KAH0797635.1 Cyclase family protein [Histomonas meleagridis]
MSVWEGDPIFRQELVCSISKGEIANVSELKLSSHCGTHIDAPNHYIQNGKGVDQVSLEKTFGHCQVIRISDEALENNLIPKSALPNEFKSKRVLLKTSNSLTPGTFRKDAIALSFEAANYLVEKEIELIGIDGLSIESYYGDGSVHQLLLGKEVVILETIDLSQVEPGEYELICLPLKIQNCDASPVRAVLRTLQ